MGQILRLIFIGLTVLRFGLDEVALSGFRQGWVRGLVRVATIGRRARIDRPRGARLRMALEKLGPIFVKFGQVLSTRRDLLPLDVADELAARWEPRAWLVEGRDELPGSPGRWRAGRSGNTSRPGSVAASSPWTHRWNESRLKRSSSFDGRRERP